MKIFIFAQGTRDKRSIMFYRDGKIHLYCWYSCRPESSPWNLHLPTQAIVLLRRA